MSAAVATVLSRAVCFDVLLKMMRTGIHHLAVARQGKIIGVITSHDVMLLQGNSRPTTCSKRSANRIVLRTSIPSPARYQG